MDTEAGPQNRILHFLNRFVKRLERRTERLNSLSRMFSRIRLGVFVGGAFLVFIAAQFDLPGVAWVVLVVFGTVFVLVAIRHDRIIKSIRRHRVYTEIKRTHIARVERDWGRIPVPEFAPPDPRHPFETDLDIVGPRSLHHLVDTAITLEGSSRLKDWLTAPEPDVPATRRRQQLVVELTPLDAFRDRLALLNAATTSDHSQKWEGDVLLAWLQTHVDRARIRPILFLLSGLAVVTPVLFMLQLTAGLSSWWIGSFMAYAAIYLLNSSLYSSLFDEAEHLYYQLERFRPVILFLERFQFGERGRLKSLCEVFQTSQPRPSACLRRAMWLSIAASGQKSDVMRLVLNILLPWDLLFAYLLSLYKKNLRDRLPCWLDALRELEAAGSLASFAWLNPHTCSPDVSETVRPVFSATQLGHPLLPDRVKIRNDFEVDSLGRIALITGSNMSGKSTFLRTLGVNLSLAYAGGPVDADSFRTSSFRLFSCINVSDSVSDGISYFYAEVKRLKSLLVALETPNAAPVFFLVDEIFRGTNNRERFVGSRSLLHRFMSQNGTGVVSTHDLELVHLEEETDQVKNFHFRETVADGKMVFDYKLRSGPCPTTNALKIMALEGLPIPEDQG